MINQLIKVVIVDDEVLARQRIRILLADYDFIEIADECANGKKAIESINVHAPDLVFMDIQMPDMSGFDVLGKLNSNFLPLVIFITAFDSYAIKAFDYFTLDYLVKPFRDSRFKESLEKVLKYFGDSDGKNMIKRLQHLIDSIPPESLDSKNDSKIILKSGLNYVLVEIGKISHIKSSGPYIEVLMESGKKHLHRSSMANILKEINHKSFVQVHRSTIVNLDYTSEISSTGMGEIFVLMKNGVKLNVGKTYKKSFLKRLNISEG